MDALGKRKSTGSQDADLPPVTVRDFAYARDDARFEGHHPPAPPQASSSSQDDSGEVFEPGSLSSSFKNSCASRLFTATRRQADETKTVSWGFVTSHDEYDSRFDSDDDDDEDAVDDEVYGKPRGRRRDDFVRGIYEALFDFEPEMPSEMRLDTGDLVNVVERKCAGWVRSSRRASLVRADKCVQVLASRIVDGVVTDEEGLVPENYLQLLMRDEDASDASSDGDAAGEGHEADEASEADAQTHDESAHVEAAADTPPHRSEKGATGAESVAEQGATDAPVKEANEGSEGTERRADEAAAALQNVHL